MLERSSNTVRLTIDDFKKKRIITDAAETEIWSHFQHILPDAYITQNAIPPQTTQTLESVMLVAVNVASSQQHQAEERAKEVWLAHFL